MSKIIINYLSVIEDTITNERPEPKQLIVSYETSKDSVSFKIDEQKASLSYELIESIYLEMKGKR